MALLFSVSRLVTDWHCVLNGTLVNASHLQQSLNNIKNYMEVRFQWSSIK